MNGKTDYAALGKASLEKLRYSTEHAFERQKELLLKLLRENENTEYGKRYGFSSINSFEEYQRRVPVSTYEDYEPYIEGTMRGERAQLTSEAPIYYCITSGSIGEPKYQPLTEADIRVHYDYAYGAIIGIIQEHYPELGQDEIFGRIFHVGEFAKTYDKSGVMNGVRSSSLYQWLDRDGGFDASNYCVPKEVLFPERLEDLTYIRARFALADRGITAVSGIFIHRMTEMLRYIEENWEMLLRDMESGETDEGVPIRDEWKEKLKSWLPKDPERAAELRNIPKETLADGMIKKLWGKTRYVLCIGGTSFAPYMKQLEKYARDVPIHYFAYAATEGIFGIAYRMNTPDSYVLLPDAGIFELAPQGECSGQAPLSMTEVRVGEKYELIFTSLSGLYRYRMMDVVEVIGFYGKAPVIRFCCRINQVLNIAGEKMNMDQMGQAIESFRMLSGLEFRDWCVCEDHSTHPARYLVYIESPPCDGADEMIDGCMRSSSVGYDGCRNLNEITAPLLHFVPEGSFAGYEKSFREKPREAEQIKPLHLLNTEERKKFFADLTKGC